jgi:hypothetical protein
VTADLIYKKMRLMASLHNNIHIRFSQAKGFAGISKPSYLRRKPVSEHDSWILAVTFLHVKPSGSSYIETVWVSSTCKYFQRSELKKTQISCKICLVRLLMKFCILKWTIHIPTCINFALMCNDWCLSLTQDWASVYLLKSRLLRLIWRNRSLI